MLELGGICSVKDKLPAFDPDERIFTLSDVHRLFKSLKRRLIQIALIGGLCGFVFCAIKAPKYKIEATFKEGVEKSGGDSVLKDFLGGMSVAQQPQAVALMKSHQVLKPLIQKLGLQAGVKKGGWIVGKVFRRISDNFKAEREKPLEDLDSFVFQDLVYEGEQKLNFTLRFSDRDQFAVYLPGQKKEIALGSVGSNVSLPNVQFTLAQVPKSLKINSSYPLQIGSWIGTAKKLREQIQIASGKTNKSIYDLTFSHRDRHLGVQILNELMAGYQKYLKKDHDELANEQLSYLEQKQEQLYDKMSTMFDDHVAYLSRNLGTKGFIALEQESDTLLTPHQNMLAKVLSIDLELSRLDQMGKENLVAVADEGPFSAKLNQIGATMRELRQQRDLLELSLQHKQNVNDGSQLEFRREELKEIRGRREAAQRLLETIEKGLEVPLSSFNLNRPLALWAQKVHESEDVEDREDLAEYLENFERLLSVREKMLQERFFYGSDTPSELEGIDLQTSKSLFVEYNNKLDRAEASMRHFDQLKKEIQLNDFELSSLSSILHDPLSQNLITQASELALRLKDEKYHSSKEGERWQQELTLQRKILSDHLEQLFKVEELNASLIREKIRGLQQVSLDCINQQLSVYYEQAADAVKERREALIQEKKLLETKMQDIRDLASELPEKWRLEKWLELKTEMGTKMMETLTNLVESKTIGHHLHHVESKPLDFAILPELPQKPGLFTMAFLGAFGAAFGTFFLKLVRTILKGFPTSAEKLRAMRFPFAGVISPFCDGPETETIKGPDLEVLRQLALFLEEKPHGKTIALIEGRGPDYSYSFAENLARMSYKSVILRCDFTAKFRNEDLPGLLQIWKGEIAELPIRKGNGFDYITAGGFSPFGAEVIQSRAFSELLELLKNNYDWVFLLIRSPLADAESKTALRLCDKAIVTITGEQTELLTPFADWAYHEGRCRLTFVTS